MNLELEFIASAINALIHEKHDILTSVKTVIKPEHFQDKKIASLWQKIIESKNLETLFPSLNGEKTLFYELLEKAPDSLSIAIVPLAKEIINEWRQREIKKLTKLYTAVETPEERSLIHQKIQTIETYDPFDKNSLDILRESILSQALTEEDLNIEFDWLYEDLIMQGTYNVFFAPPSSGKSMFALALAIHLVKSGKINIVYYLDGDNSLATIKKRNIKQIIKDYPEIKYFHCKSSNQMRELASQLASIPDENALVVIDSLKDLAGGDYSLDKSKEAKKIDDIIKKLRDSNGTPKTVVVLHHVAKNSELPTVFKSKGNTIFQDSAEQTYFFRKVNQDSEAIYLELEEGKHKLSFKRFKFKITINTYHLEELDLILSKEDQDIIETARKVLEEHGAALTFDDLVTRVSKRGLPHKKTYYTLKNLGEKFFVFKHEKYPRRILVSLPSWINFDRTAELAELQNSSVSTVLADGEKFPTDDTIDNDTELQSLQNCRTVEKQQFQPKVLNINSSAGTKNGNGTANSANSLTAKNSAALHQGEFHETVEYQDFCNSARLNKNPSKPPPNRQVCRDCQFYKPLANMMEGECEKLRLFRAPDYTRCRYFVPQKL